MDSFIITLALTVICNFFAMRRFRGFNGASSSAYYYLMFSANIGTLLVYGLVIASCFITTWWVPLLAVLIANVIEIVIPLNSWGELICALLWPVFFVATILLMIF